MKNLICTLVGTSLALGALAYADPASAQFRGLRDAVRDVKKTTDDAEEVANTAKDVVETVCGKRQGRRSRRSSGQVIFSRGSRSATPETAAAPDNAGGSSRAPSRLSSQVSCANLSIGNAFVGRDGEYTFAQGISTQKRSGIIDRRPVTASNGCIYEGLAVGDVLYVEFDAARFKKTTTKYSASHMTALSNSPIRMAL